MVGYVGFISGMCGMLQHLLQIAVRQDQEVVYKGMDMASRMTSRCGLCLNYVGSDGGKNVVNFAVVPL